DPVQADRQCRQRRRAEGSAGGNDRPLRAAAGAGQDPVPHHLAEAALRTAGDHPHRRRTRARPHRIRCRHQCRSHGADPTDSGKLAALPAGRWQYTAFQCPHGPGRAAPEYRRSADRTAAATRCRSPRQRKTLMKTITRNLLQPLLATALLTGSLLAEAQEYLVELLVFSQPGAQLTPAAGPGMDWDERATALDDTV